MRSYAHDNPTIGQTIFSKIRGLPNLKELDYKSDIYQISDRDQNLLSNLKEDLALPLITKFGLRASIFKTFDILSILDLSKLEVLAL